MQVSFSNFKPLIYKTSRSPLVLKTAMVSSLGIIAGMNSLKNDVFTKTQKTSLQDILGKNFNNTKDSRIADIKSLWQDDFNKLEIKETIDYLGLNEDEKVNYLQSLLTPLRQDIDNRSVSLSSIETRLNLSKSLNIKLAPENKDDISKIISKTHFQYQTDRTNYAIDTLQNTKKISNEEIVKYLKSLRSLEHPHMRADIVSNMLNYDYLTKDEALGLTILPIGAKDINDFGKVAKTLSKIIELEPEQKNRILKERKFDYIELKKKKFVLSLIGKDELSKYDDKTIDSSLKFAYYYNRLDVHELSKKKKKDLINLLVANNYLLFDASKDFYKNFPILPDTVQKYCDLMTVLVSSIGVNGRTLTDDEMEKYQDNITHLENILKTTHIKNEKMTLAISQQDFVNSVNDLTKGLTKYEKEALTGTFGFKIRDNKLNGHPTLYKEDFNEKDMSYGSSLTDKMRMLVENYNKHNYITVSKNKELEKVINKLGEYLPEIYTLFDKDDNAMKMLTILQNVVKSIEYQKLNENDKDILKMATLLSRIDRNKTVHKNEAFSSFYLAKRFNYSNEDLNKIHKIVEQQSFIKNIKNSDDKISEMRYTAFRLKDDNLLEMTKILSDAKRTSSIEDSKDITDILKSYIDKIKKYDFILPQISSSDIIDVSKQININGYNIKVANSKDIKNFYAFLHSPEKVENTSNTRNLKLFTLNSFGVLDDDKVLCTSYVSSEKIGALADFGLLMNVTPDNIYAGVGYDMESPYRMGKKDLVKYYMFDTSRKDNKSLEYTYEHRKFISEQLRKIMDIDEEEYIKRFDKIKHCLTLDEIGQIDAEFKSAYEKFLSIPCHNMLGDGKEKVGLMRDGDHWNEILVTNPKVSAIFTRNLEKTPEEYLVLASKYNLPLVLI